MANEIERKWLLKGGELNFPTTASVYREQLWQYYLNINLDMNGNVVDELRIRYKAGSNNGAMTYKAGNGLVRYEYEDKLFSARRFVRKLSVQSGKKPIKKERYVCNFQGHNIEINIVDDTWAYAEVEFDSVVEADKYVFPWMGIVEKEVTGIPKYSMARYWIDTREQRQV